MSKCSFQVVTLAVIGLIGWMASAAYAADPEPFQRRVSVVVANGESFGRTEFVASETKRLVIEHVSYAAQVPPGSGQNALVVISTTVGGNTLGHAAAAGVNIGGVVAAGQTTATADRVVASHPMRIYADSKTKVAVSVERHGPRTGAVSTFIMISGYLENQ